MFKDAIDCYEAMGKALSKSVKEPWDEVCAEAELDEESVDLLVMYKPRGGSKLSGNIPDVPMLARYIYELARLVSTPEKGLFKKCIFTLTSDGKYNADFAY